MNEKLSDYSEAKASLECMGVHRMPSSSILKQKARRMHEEANRLENLAQLFDFMPKEIESALYPLIEKEYGRY